MATEGHLQSEARLSDKGRLVIPAAMREALGLRPGVAVELRLIDNEIRISTRQSRLLRAQEWVRDIAPARVSLADELSEERRQSAKHE